MLLDTTTAHDCNNTHSNLDSSVGTAPPPLLQEDYRIGASVYDRSHNNNPRGYGEISRRASPDDNGNPRYYIAFSTGQRITAMKETYLELSHIHHRDRVPATALQQRILVVLGTHKGKSGLTIAKVGRERERESVQPAATTHSTTLPYSPHAGWPELEMPPR